MASPITNQNPSGQEDNNTAQNHYDPKKESSEQDIFERAIRALEAEIANIGTHATIDGKARQTYAQQIRSMADELRAEARSGHITWRQAAEQAEEARNLIMDMIRGRSTPVGHSRSKARAKHSMSWLGEKHNSCSAVERNSNR